MNEPTLLYACTTERDAKEAFIVIESMLIVRGLDSSLIEVRPIPPERLTTVTGLSKDCRWGAWWCAHVPIGYRERFTKDLN